MKKEEINFNYLKKRDYIIKNLLDNDSYYTLYEVEKIRKYVNKLYEIFKEIEIKKEIK